MTLSVLTIGVPRHVRPRGLCLDCVLKTLRRLNRSRLSGGLLVIFSLGAAAFGRDLTPPSPTQPWSPPGLEKYQTELAQEASRPNPDTVQIDPKKIYDLPELIDLAERNNPETRIAWERARAAAAAVGLSQSTYYPYLAASAGAGYARAFLPFPSLTVAVACTSVVVAMLRVMLLFPFSVTAPTVGATLPITTVG